MRLLMIVSGPRYTAGGVWGRRGAAPWRLERWAPILGWMKRVPINRLRAICNTRGLTVTFHPLAERAEGIGTNGPDRLGRQAQPLANLVGRQRDAVGQTKGQSQDQSLARPQRLEQGGDSSAVGQDLG